MKSSVLESINLTDSQFRDVATLVQAACGIHLHDGKKELVKGRLSKRLRHLGFHSFQEYIGYLRKDSSGAEITAMLDAISTNQTSFFREAEHFAYLADKVLPGVVSRNAGSKRLRIWSAGCSSGEEPYSIAITMCESIANLSAWDARILATDISTRVLAHAAQGVYDAERVQSVVPKLRNRHFNSTGAHSERRYEAKSNLKSMIQFARLNLMERWPMKGPFDTIFCRNVMIYFDRPTRERLVGRYYDLLAPGGTFFVGHSESLTGLKHQFRYVQPTVYEKP
jgi:chemotaxis protein methyltransferase CheR